jgi:hypothetical protein
MMGTGKAATLIAMGLMLGLGACDDSAAKQKANDAAKAEAEVVAKAAKSKEQIGHNVDCLSALRWQKAGLASANIGDVDVYEAYFREKLNTALGSQMLTDPPAPMLSRATLPDYLDWAYPEAVKTKFTAGKDQNGDGTVSSAERNSNGFNVVTSCVLEVAEAGKGALAGNDKVGRAERLVQVRGRLKDKGV